MLFAAILLTTASRDIRTGRRKVVAQTVTVATPFLSRRRSLATIASARIDFRDQNIAGTVWATLEFTGLPDRGPPTVTLISTDLSMIFARYNPLVPSTSCCLVEFLLDQLILEASGPLPVSRDREHPYTLLCYY